MTISNEAIEAAARAIYDVRDDPYDDDEWEEMDGTDREECICLARAALTAAAPYIQAAALRDAAGHLMVNMTEPSGEAYRILHERANSIEGKES